MSTLLDSFDQSRLSAFVQSPLLGSGAVPAEVIIHPVSQTVNQGQTATFNVTAIGTSPISYQWQRSDNGGISWTNVGTNQNSYTTPATVASSDNGDLYRCIVSNDYGTDISATATLTVNAASYLPRTILLDMAKSLSGIRVIYNRLDNPYGTFVSDGLQAESAPGMDCGKLQISTNPANINRKRVAFVPATFPGTVPNSTISNAVLTFKPNFLLADEAFNINIYWIDTAVYGGLGLNKQPYTNGIFASNLLASFPHTSLVLNVDNTVNLDISVLNAEHGKQFAIIFASSVEIAEAGALKTRAGFRLASAVFDSTVYGKVEFS
jgi:hypothetical protein